MKKLEIRIRDAFAAANLPKNVPYDDIVIII